MPFSISNQLLKMSMMSQHILALRGDLLHGSWRWEMQASARSVTMVALRNACKACTSICLIAGDTEISEQLEKYRKGLDDLYNLMWAILYSSQLRKGSWTHFNVSVLNCCMYSHEENKSVWVTWSVCMSRDVIFYVKLLLVRLNAFKHFCPDACNALSMIFCHTIWQHGTRWVKVIG